MRDLLASIHRNARAAYLERFTPPNDIYSFRTRWSMLNQSLEESPETVLDVGAYRGEFTSQFRSLWPDAEIHAIDPVPEHVDSLRQRFGDDPGAKIHPIAAGPTDDEISINVTGKSHSSSVLRPSQLDHLTDGADVVDTLTVDQRRLDGLVDSVEVLKLDVQGYEKDVLEGASDLLDGVQAILSEVQFTPHYDGAVRFGELDVYLADRGFEFVTMFEPYTGEAGKMYFADCLWVRE